MLNYLILTIVSFLISGILFIPFINLLYKLKFQDSENSSKDLLGRISLFNKLRGHKVGTPSGGGILIILVSLILITFYFLFTYSYINWTALILIITLGLFGLLGFLDDIQKFFRVRNKNGSFLRVRYKLLIQLVFSLTISILLYNFLGKSSFGLWYILYSTLVITFFTNAFNITDGMDGLSGGLLLIILAALGIGVFGNGDILIVIATLFGSVLAFMYFNVSPARLFMGDTGALAFGAIIAVISLIAGISIPLFIMGAVFVVEGLSSLIQWGSFVFRNGKRVFKIAPLHHHFEALGWDEDKVVIRFWLAGIACGLFGLLLNQLFLLNI
ncbi:MAG: hypothetical protein ABIB98_00485 [bacterium]